MKTDPALQPKRPQLSDSIERLDEMIDGLGTAIPGAVADSVREVLGTILPLTVQEVLCETLKEGTTEVVRVAAREAAVVAVAAISTSVTPARSETEPDATSWVQAGISRLCRLVARRTVLLVARLALVWAIVKQIGGTTIRSPSAALSTMLVGAGAAVTGYVVGPLGAAILLGLAAGSIAAAVWAAPTV